MPGGLGLGLGIGFGGVPGSGAVVGTAPEDLSDAVLGLSGDDSYTTVGEGDHVDTGTTEPTNLVSGGTAINKVGASYAHFLHRADWEPTLAGAVTMSLPNGHYFFSNNQGPFDNTLATRAVIKHNIISPVTSSEQTVIQVVFWTGQGAGGYATPYYDHNVQFYNYRKDNFRGDLKTPLKTIQTTAAMEYAQDDTWMVFAYSFGADDFNHWIDGKEMTVLAGESGLGGNGTPSEMWVSNEGNEGIAEFWAYSVKHSKADIQSVMKHLCHKYGITYTNQPL